MNAMSQRKNFFVIKDFIYPKAEYVQNIEEGLALFLINYPQAGILRLKEAYESSPTHPRIKQILPFALDILKEDTSVSIQ